MYFVYVIVYFEYLPKQWLYSQSLNFLSCCLNSGLTLADCPSSPLCGRGLTAYYLDLACISFYVTSTDSRQFAISFASTPAQ